jgi:hypothetical protein
MDPQSEKSDQNERREEAELQDAQIMDSNEEPVCTPRRKLMIFLA